jgi:hypothetical protein
MQPIAELLRLSLTATSSGYSLRLIYLKWLQPYEKQLEEAVDQSYDNSSRSETLWPQCVLSLDGKAPRKRSHGSHLAQVRKVLL